MATDVNLQFIKLIDKLWPYLQSWDVEVNVSYNMMPVKSDYLCYVSSHQDTQYFHFE